MSVPTSGSTRWNAPPEQGPGFERRSGVASLPVPRPVGADEFRGSSRYELLVKIASGGSASVYVGRVTGSAGFSRLVAVKRAHPHLAHDPAVKKMLRTEAQLASGLNHANVVAVQDVEQVESELLLILDYVEGASLSELLSIGAQSGKALPPRVAIRIVLDACAGLAAVHEIEGKDGRPVGFLHRDVSPQNILVGIDGTARITDFGLAKHICSDATKASGMLQGKLAYLAPEIIDRASFSVRSDLFAMAVVMWEALARRRLFQGDSWADTVRKVGLVQPPSLATLIRGLDPRVDHIVARALDKDPERRHPTVRAFAAALEDLAVERNLVATSSEVSGYVHAVVGEALRRRRALIRPFQPDDVMEDLLTTQTITTFPRLPGVSEAAALIAAPAPRPAPPLPAAVPPPRRHGPAAAVAGPDRLWVTPPEPRVELKTAPDAGFAEPSPARHAPPARYAPPPRHAPHPPPVRVRAPEPPPPPMIEEDELEESTISRHPGAAAMAPAAHEAIAGPPTRRTLVLAEQTAPPTRRTAYNTLPLTPEPQMSRPEPQMSRPEPQMSRPAPQMSRPAPARPETIVPPPWRAQSSSPRAHVSGALLRRPARVEVEEPPATLRDGATPQGMRRDNIDEDDLRLTAVRKGASTAWADPLSPWVPPTMPPQARPAPARRRWGRAIAGVVTLGAVLGAAALVGPAGLQDLQWRLRSALAAPAAPAAPAAQTAAAATQAAPAAVTAAPQPRGKATGAQAKAATPGGRAKTGAQAQAKAKAGKKGASAPAATAKAPSDAVKPAGSAEPLVLVPDELPDVTPGQKQGEPAAPPRRSGEPLTPDELPDVTPRGR